MIVIFPSIYRLHHVPQDFCLRSKCLFRAIFVDLEEFPKILIIQSQTSPGHSRNSTTSCHGFDNFLQSIKGHFVDKNYPTFAQLGLREGKGTKN